MKKFVFSVLAAGCLAVVYCAGLCVGARVQRSKTAQSAKDCGTEARKLADAEKKIADLKRRLAAAKAANEKTARQTVKAAAEPSAGKKDEVILSAGPDVDILDEMKKRLSEEDFKNATNALARLKANMAAKAKGKIEFLKSVDVSGMTKDERADHQKFIELVEYREAIRSNMKLGLPDPKVMQDLVKTEMRISVLSKKERATLSRRLAAELGYAGEDAEAVCDAVKNIYDCTGNGLDNMMEMAEGASGVEIGTSFAL